MFLKLLDRVTALPLWTRAAVAVATVASFQWTRGWLEASCAASRYPVDFATGQTAFSGEKIKSYFAHTQKTGTLDVYWTTQVIDYGFILAMACMGLFVCTFVARFSRGGRLQRPFADGQCGIRGPGHHSPLAGEFRSIARESFAPRVARTIPQSGFSGRTATAGKCVVKATGEGLLKKLPRAPSNGGRRGGPPWPPSSSTGKATPPTPP